MSKTPEEKRERLRQEELKKPSSSIHGSNLADLVGGIGWKGTGLLLIILVVVAIVLFIIF